MTIDEIRKAGKECLSPQDIAGVLGSQANTIRLTAIQYPERIGYPFTFSGNRMKIPKDGFLKWYEGK